MTEDEKKAQMLQRNADICAYYKAGNNVAACGKRFKLKRQRIQQILQQAGAWTPHVRSDRVKHLGVTVSEETKNGLKQLAEERGVSVSKLAADELDGIVAKAR